MIQLTETDKLILEQIQQDFPLVSRPFKFFGAKINITESQVIERIKYFLSNNIIREIAALFISKQMGYKSTLIAVCAPENTVQTLARKISLHPGVSHNYLRNNKYNIWFTLTIKKEKDFKTELQMIFNNNSISYLNLLSLRKFKIRVNFNLTVDNHSQKLKNINKKETTEKDISSYGFSELNKQIITQLQKNIKPVKEPWKEIADNINISENKLFDVIKALKKQGALKRVSAVLRHRNIGFNFNGMICFNIPEKDIPDAGKKIAEFSEVSHCYQRQTYPDWKYSIFAMVHTRTRKDCEYLINKIADSINCSDYITLYSIKEFKKEKVKYFMLDKNK